MEAMAAWRRALRLGGSALLVGAIVLGGCATPPPPPPPAPLPERPAPPATEPAFDAGIDFAVDDLFVQAQRLPAFAPRPATAAKDAAPPAPRGVFVVDAVIDGSTGQQTAAGKALEERLFRRTAERFPQFDVLPVSGDNLRRAQYLLVGTITPADAAAATGGAFRINLSLTEVKSGFVVAQAATRVRGQGVDATPTAFYRDSPSLTKDRVIEGQIRTAATPSGKEADAVYLERLPTNALATTASSLYDAGNYAEALRYYEQAAARPDGQQLRILNGLYLANMQQDRAEAAEQAFARIVALGLATNSLSVKFLFRPGSTDFLADPKISGPYTMWLRVIARQIIATKSCVTVVGHTSRTGSEQINERLSLSRAVAIQRRLEGLVSEPLRLQAAGVGSRENLVGAGTDDMRDALDRRVEFKVRGC